MKRSPRKLRAAVTLAVSLLAGCGASKTIMFGPIGTEGAATLQYMTLIPFKSGAVATKLVAVQGKPVAEGAAELIELPPGEYELSFRWLAATDAGMNLMVLPGGIIATPAVALNEPERRFQLRIRLESQHTYRVHLTSMNSLPDRICLESRPSVDDELSFYKSGRNWPGALAITCSK